MGFQNNKERVPQIGEVYLMKFGGSGSEQSGWRPGVVFQNNGQYITTLDIEALLAVWKKAAALNAVVPA